MEMADNRSVKARNDVAGGYVIMWSKKNAQYLVKWPIIGSQKWIKWWMFEGVARPLSKELHYTAVHIDMYSSEFRVRNSWREVKLENIPNSGGFLSYPH